MAVVVLIDGFIAYSCGSGSRLSIIIIMLPMSQRVYLPEHVRELDKIAIKEQGIAGYELMQRAGQAACAIALAEFPGARHWLIVCGSGNNAGDGYVIARLACRNDIKVSVVALADPEQLTGDARLAWDDYSNNGGAVKCWAAGSTELPAECDLIVDALLGTGLTRTLTGEYRTVVELLNAYDKPVLAIDTPSGLNSTSGEIMGAAIKAEVTVSFVGLKQGFFLAQGPDQVGELHFDDLSIAAAGLGAVPIAMQIFEQPDARACLARRSRVAHKADCGHVLVVGGNHGMGGAVRLAGEAALRSGAGLVSVATRADNVAAVVAGRPELMCHAVESAAELQPLIDRATAIAIGPGLGKDKWAQQRLHEVLATELPLVVDADALNLLADDPQQRDNWILTPHPGEAGRLLGIPSKDVQADRPDAVSEIVARYGGAVLLKGHATLVSGSSRPWLIRAGNPGMATAGMGDVLTGIIAALLAQNLSAVTDQDMLSQLVATAAWVHATTADRIVANDGERGLIASDLFTGLRATLNP